MSEVVIVRDSGSVLPAENEPQVVTVRGTGEVTPVDSTPNVITLIGGPPGLPGPAGPAGPQGNTNLVVSDTNPNFTEPGLWIETEIGPNNDMTFWVEDGVV